MTKVAGTIVISNSKSTTFLVTGEAPYHFLSIESEKEHATVLATMLEYLKNSVGVDTDCLRLEELSMVKGDNKQTLFVFSIHDHEGSVVTACQRIKGLKFVEVDQLQHLFQTIEMDTAPFFD
ncbi:hypothetical protein [Paucilactobacillus kaifaensis]|uniref:hypothetical protein n=1 Tax=Paucilactobacillus kaifaensis TaxID=2559921 RepID=UPI0010F4BFB0|nr:hypothetical protein [Paucilactobacillus kaifaensis]